MAALDEREKGRATKHAFEKIFDKKAFDDPFLPNNNAKTPYCGNGVSGNRYLTIW